MTERSPLDLEPIKRRLAAVPAGVIEPDSLTFTRLGPDGGALHIGGGDGIVYSACAIASIDRCPEDRDVAMALMTQAPADLVAAIAEIERLRRIFLAVANNFEQCGHPDACLLARQYRAVSRGEL